MPLGGVAGTGLAVAAIRARESARPDRLFDDPLAAAFAALRTAGTAPGSEPGAAAGNEPGTAPGSEPGGPHAAALRAWVVARTVFLDEMLNEACAAGIRQVVLLGAGFDARAFRLPWPPGVRCFELDTPDVLGVKEQVLAAQQARPGCERIPVPCDLRADWPAGLAAAGFDPGQPAAWIAEGLLVYLDPDAVDRLVHEVTRLSAPGSRAGLTFRNRVTGAGGGSLGPALRRSAAPDDPAGWLAGHGWSATLASAREVLAAHGRVSPSRPAQPGPPRALLVSARRERAGAAAAATGSRPAERPSRPTSRTPPLTTPPPQPPGAEAARPLPALLSQALVAFTIELDNEFEHRMPHRTTWGPAAGAPGPWHVSQVMWANFLQFVPPGGVPFREVAALARLVNLAGLQRWGYLVIAPDGAAGGPPPPRQDWLVRLTPAGRQAQQAWRPLAGEIEQRWRERLGAVDFGWLRAGLGAVAARAAAGFPPYLPVSGVYPADPAVLLAGARAAAGLRPPGGPGPGYGSGPGASPGSGPGAIPGSGPGASPGSGPGANPGSGPGASPGSGPGADSVSGGISPGASPTGKAGSSPRGKAGVSPPVRPGTSPAGNAAGRPAGDRPTTPTGEPGPRPAGGPGLASPGGPAGGSGLPVLLSAALLSWRLEYEQETGLSLPVSANVLRVLTPEPRRLRDLPALAGVAKEAVAVSLGLLERHGYAATGPDPGARRGQAAWLTERGRDARARYLRLASTLQERWQARFGAAPVTALSESLGALFVVHEGQSAARAALAPYPEGWRANPPYLARTRQMISDPAAALPHYPMVSHRGGFPDGS